MARRQYNVHSAKTNLSRLLNEVLAGEEVVIARAGRPVAKLVRYSTTDAPRRPGVWRNKVWIAADFDELPAELEAAFYSEDA